MAKQKSNAAKNIIVLFVIALFSVSILAVLNQVTKDPIAKAEQEARQTAYMSVYDGADEIKDIDIIDYTPADAEANVTINALLEAYKDGEQVGYVVDATSPNGYGGDVQIAVGITNEGEITAFTVISAASETPGLGAKSTEEEFQSQFSGLSALTPVDFSKTGADRSKNEYDAISGATITSTAVKQAVNEAIALYNTVKGE